MTTLVVQVEQSVQCACVCVQTITCELNDLWPRWLACWFNLRVIIWNARDVLLD